MGFEVGLKTRKIKVLRVTSMLFPKKADGEKEMALVFFVIDDSNQKYQYMAKEVTGNIVSKELEILATIQPGDFIEITSIKSKINVYDKESINKIIKIVEIESEVQIQEN